ncbi:MAG TPA: hypothetical protein VGQ81_12415 [Acidobacteriota bacterium]|nr:hypothetical protein [Acidobacteriota bacterium]
MKIDKIDLIVRAALRGCPNACAIIGKTGDHTGSPVQIKSIVSHLLTLGIAILVSLVLIFVSSSAAFESRPSAPVYITLWFDTEDYVSPEPDQAILRICRILEKHGVKATFKLIAEKARDLERKKQFDVIEALKKHDIGFHTQTHSQPPHIPQYLDAAGWEAGIEQFDVRERGGVQELKRIFKTAPLCYGQPGNSWAPQTYPVLLRWGIPLYLDEGDHAGINNQPFWYGGILNVYKMGPNLTRMNLDSGEPGLAEATRNFDAIYNRLSNQGGGLVSIYYHPNEWVDVEFWDAVNFSYGANPARERWVAPRKKTAEASEQSFRLFDLYVGYMKAKPQVKFVGAREILDLYPDSAREALFTRSAIESLAKQMRSEITFQKTDNGYLSSSEIFSLLLEAYLNPEARSVALPSYTLFGPAEKLAGNAGGPVSRYGFDKGARELRAIVNRLHRLPNLVWLGSSSVSPVDFLATLAKQIGNPADPVSIMRGNLTASRYIADDSPQLFSWVILPEGFHAPRVMELAKLQAWTLKPAVLAGKAPVGSRREAGSRRQWQ